MFSPNGSTVYCVTRDETIEAHDANTGELQHAIRRASWHTGSQRKPLKLLALHDDRGLARQKLCLSHQLLNRPARGDEPSQFPRDIRLQT